MASSPPTIPHVPAPWTNKATIYTFPFYVTSSRARNLPSVAYSPLEAGSSFADGTCVGGLGIVQVLRYSDSPVGPYDEMLLAPGNFEYNVNEDGKDVKKSNLRITRIWVSQKHTCYNGRKNWNIPKHLARFEFIELATGRTEIRVFPHDTGGVPGEAKASDTPYFTAIYTPSPYLPAFPASLRIFGYIGIDLSLVQPPLPKGDGSQGELPGTQGWHKILPVEYTKKARIGWFDLRQTRDSSIDQSDPTERDSLLGHENRQNVKKASEDTFQNGFPGLGRWRFGIKMEDATANFEVGEHWD